MTRKKAAIKGRTKLTARAPADPERLLIQGARVITLDAHAHTGKLDLLIEGEHIAAIGEKLDAKGAQVLDASRLIAMPGLVQGHVHLCQTLFRGQADDLELLTWLSERIWPLEGALEADDLRASARLGIAELLLGGTTSILDMGTVRHSDVLFEEARGLGLRYTGGKTIMDHGHGFPAGLRETTAEAIAESVRLCKRWHGEAGGRLRYAFSPRFVLSCSEEAMRACVKEARAHKALMHTHASENSEEVGLVRERTGMGNVEYLHSLGFSGPDVILAHGVWLTAEDKKILQKTRTRITHCPSANLKLASGIARLSEMIDEGIELALGADGAACNNNLDGFMEMRLAALLHKVRGGPTAVPALTALRLATSQSAKALGLTDVGTLEVGKRADLILLDLDKPHATPEGSDLHSRVVYAAKSSDVHTVLVDGRVVVRDGELVAAAVPEILADARSAMARVQKRLG
jgi:5-methylthioadenosine/S-adenosylhomocysteine deaminase